MITRIDDDLHQRLKQRAAEQERSLNDLVSSILAEAVPGPPLSLRERLARSGMQVFPPKPASPPPTMDELLERLRGTGTAVSEALAADRDGR